MVEGAQTSDRSNVTSKPCPFGDLQAPGPSAAQCQQMDLRWPPLGHCGFTIPQQLHKYSQSRITLLFCTHREAGVEAGYEASPALTMVCELPPQGGRFQSTEGSPRNFISLLLSCWGFRAHNGSPFILEPSLDHLILFSSFLQACCATLLNPLPISASQLITFTALIAQSALTTSLYILAWLNVPSKPRLNPRLFHFSSVH